MTQILLQWHKLAIRCLAYIVMVIMVSEAIMTDMTHKCLVV